MMVWLGVGVLCCSGGSSSNNGDDIKTPGEDCADETSRDDPWCDGERNACVNNTCRLPCDAASDCTVLLNHICCEIESDVTEMACLPEMIAPTTAECL